MKVICPYCGQRAWLTDSRFLYQGKHNFGPVYLCRPCDAYVGCHKDTDKPLGTLANKELREYRRRVHSAFDYIWRGKLLPSRTAAYKWLAYELGLDYSETHIAKFDVETCKKAIAVCREFLRNFNNEED